jgi:ATP-dependent Lhr-like helicase
VLRGLEEAGKIRRGYFVRGLGGLQFAHRGALDRLRALREGSAPPKPARILSATDPAQPFGAILPWPRLESGQPARVPGAHVALVEGRLVAFLTKEEGEVLASLPQAEPDRSRVGRALAEGLALWLEERGRRQLGWSLDAPSLAEGALAPFLLDAGFQRSGPGLRLVRSRLAGG